MIIAMRGFDIVYEGLYRLLRLSCPATGINTVVKCGTLEIIYKIASLMFHRHTLGVTGWCHPQLDLDGCLLDSGNVRNEF